MSPTIKRVEMKKAYILMYSNPDGSRPIEAFLNEETAITRWRECMEGVFLDASQDPYEAVESIDGEVYWLEIVTLTITGG